MRNCTSSIKKSAWLSRKKTHGNKWALMNIKFYFFFLYCKRKNLEVRRFQYTYYVPSSKTFLFNKLQDIFKFVTYNIFFEETCHISFLSIKKILSGNYKPNCLFDAVLLPRKMCICLPVTLKLRRLCFYALFFS